jgi:hypothetical protein
MTPIDNPPYPGPISSLKAILENQATQWFSRFIFIFGLACFFTWLSIYAITIITTPVPIEYREGAILLSTGYLLQGLNPYALANQPLSMNVYGLGYNLVVLPFAALMGNTLAIHRVISIICLVLSGMIVSQWLMLKGASRLFAFSGSLILFASLLFYTTPVSRPDALGVLLISVSFFL